MTISRWPLVELRCLTKKIGSGATPTGGKGAYLSSGIPLIRSMNIHDLEFVEDELAFIDERQAKKLDNVTTQSGDVLLNITGASVARCCFLPERYVGGRVNQHVAILRPHPSKLDGRFLAYVLVSAAFKGQLLSIAGAGATREALTKAGLERFAVPAPPVKTQQRIAAILGAYDDLIEVNRRRVAVLEEMARGLFEEWFVRFRFPGHEAVPILDTPDGPLPKGWAFEALGNLADIQWGDTSTTKKSYTAVGYRAYSASGPDGFMPTFDFDRVGVVLSAIGAKCGKTWIARGQWSCIKNTMRFWANDGGVGTEYLFLALSDADKWPKRGAAQPFISLGDARKIKLVKPDRATSERFSATASAMLELADSLLSQNEKLAASRDLLLPRLISGQLSIETAERVLEAAA